jgi:hypothetical protein
VVVLALSWLGVTWAAFLLVDAWDVGGSRSAFAAWTAGRTEPHVWRHLWNDRLTEWFAWVLMAVFAPVAAYLGGRLRSLGHRRVGAFWAVFGLGMAFMLVEDAGDVRHVTSAYLRDLVAVELFGLHYAVLGDLVIFLAIAALPVYAVVRYGLDVWRASRSARAYLVGGVTLYGLAGGSSALRLVGGLYERLGAGFHRLVGGDLLVPANMSIDGLHYRLIDSVVEESIEFLAIALLLAGLAAFTADAAAGRIGAPDVDDEPPHRAAAGGSLEGGAAGSSLGFGADD